MKAMKKNSSEAHNRPFQKLLDIFSPEGIKKIREGLGLLVGRYKKLSGLNKERDGLKDKKGWENTGDTSFLSIFLDTLKSEENLRKLDRREFQTAFASFPTIDIGCNIDTQTLDIIFEKKLFPDFQKYIGINKYRLPEIPPSMKEKPINLHMADGLVFLYNNVQPNSSNILIGGFDETISFAPEGKPNLYRFLLMRRIAEAVGIQGYVVSSNSFHFRGEIYEGKRYKLEDFGLELLYLDVDRMVYKKPKDWKMPDDISNPIERIIFE